MSTTTRRKFLKYTTLAGGTTLFLAGTASSQKVFGANARLRVAVAGLNGRGGSHIGGFSGQKNVEIAWLIDPDRTVLERRLAELKKRSKGSFNTKGATDIRKALEDRLISARRGTDKDSHLFQLLDDYPDVAHEKTDVFRERVRYAAETKARLRVAREEHAAARPDVGLVPVVRLAIQHLRRHVHRRA